MPRVLIFGGRTYGRVPDHVEPWDREEAIALARKQRARFEQVMAAAVDRLGIDAIASGLQRGADELAMRWARRNSIPFSGFRANWQAQGRAAGPIRNQRMLDEFRPEIAIGFPGGSGTADMAKRAEAAGVRVIKIDW